MAENQNYIGVAMGLDVTDLKAGLREANKQIQLANSEFKAASSGMDDWSKSTDGLSAKVKQLDTVLTAQKSKLAGLQAEYEKVAKEQGENSEAARKLQVQINNQQAVVNRTQKEFDNYTDTLKQAKAGTLDLETATVGANGKVKEFGDTAADAGAKVESGFGAGVAAGVAGGIAAIGAAAVAAVGSFFALAESTREYREEQAKLNSAFEQAKLSSDSAKSTYEQLFRAIGESDQSVEAAQQIALLADSEKEAAKWAELATGVVGTFGDALPVETFYESANETLKLGEATGAYVQMLEGTGVNVEDFNAKLAACTTESEKQAYILSVAEQSMGAAGAAYEEGAADILAANEATAALNDATATLGAIAEPIMTTLKTLAAELLTEITPFVELIGTGLRGALEGTAGATDILAEGLSGILTSMLDRIVELAPVVIETVVAIVPKLLSEILAQLPSILKTLLTLVTQVAQALAKMLPALIPVVVDCVIMLAETLLDNIDMIIDAGIALLMGLADGLIKALPRLIDKAPVIIEKLVGAISRNLPKLIEAGISLLVSLAGGLIKAIPQLVSKIPQIISSVVNGFANYYDSMGDVGLNLLKGIWQGIKNGASWLKNKITGFAGNVADWFKTTFKIKSPSKLIEDEVGVYVGQAVVPTSAGALAKVKKQLANFSGFVSDNLGDIKTGLSIEPNGSVSANGGRDGARSTVVNAGLTVNYNGTLSRKQIKQLENDNYTAIRMRLKAEGAF